MQPIYVYSIYLILYFFRAEDYLRLFMDITDQYVKKLISGSYDAFTSLYGIYAPQLYAFVFSMTESESVTNDIVQETFIKVWIKREELKEDLSFKSFLFTIGRNKVLNEFRRQMRNPLFSDYMSLKMSGKISEEVFEENQIEKDIDFDEFNRSLQQAKKTLAPQQSLIFELNKEQGLSIEEIAIRLNIKEQVVRNQLSSALRVLRGKMGRYTLLFILFFY